MSIKYCYKEEIHKSFTIPATFNALLQDIRTIFGDSIPENFSVQYKDSEDDHVTISSDLEYRSMLRFDLPKPNGSIKLYIAPAQRGSTERIESKIIFVSNKNSEGSFEVVETDKSGTDGGISEFTLTSDEERNNRTQRSQSSDSKGSRKTDISLERRSTSSPKNDGSDRQQNDTLDNLYHIRALLLKECFAKSPRIFAHKVEVPAQMSEARNQPWGVRKLREQEMKAAKTIQMAFRRLKDLKNEGKKYFEARTVQKAFSRLQNLTRCMSDPNVSSYESDLSRDSINQRFSAHEIFEAAATFIQKNYRGYRTRKMLRKFFADHPFSDDEELLEIWSVNENSLFTPQINYDKAAETIQKAFRGFMLRKSIALLKQISLNYGLPTRGYRFQRMLKKSINDFDHRVSQRDEEERRFNEQAADSWRWAQERVQAQNDQFDRERVHGNHCSSNNSNYSPHLYQPVNMKSNSSFDSPLRWNTNDKRTQEVSENLYQSPVRDNSFRCEAHDSYEHNRQNEDVPFRSWLNLQTRYFDLKTESNPSLRSNESPYTIEVDGAYSRLKRFQQRTLPDYSYRITQGTNPSVLYFAPNNGRMNVYKTIYVENTGNKSWNRCYVRSVGTITGKTAEINNIEVGQIVLVTLELSGFFEYGHYNTHWKLVHENEHGMVESIGEPFNMDFTIEPNQATADRSRGDEQIFQRNHSFITERDDEEDENEEESDSRDMRKEDTQHYQDEGMSYDTPSFFEQDNAQDFERFINYKNEAVKVGEIRTMFPLDSLDEILAFVNQRPSLTTDEIVMAYFAMRNEC